MFMNPMFTYPIMFSLFITNTTPVTVRVCIDVILINGKSPLQGACWFLLPTN